MKKFGLQQNFKNQMKYLYLLSYLIFGFEVISGLVLRKVFSVQEVGLYFSILGFFGMLFIFRDLGLVETLNYYSVKFHERKNYKKLKSIFFYVLFLQFIISVAISAAIFLASDFLFKNFFKTEPSNILLYLLIFFISSSLTKVFSSILEVFGKYYHQQLLTFIIKTMELISLVAIFYMDLGFIYFIYAVVISNSLLLLFYLISLRSKEFKNLRKAEFKTDVKFYKEMHKFAFHIMIGSGLTLMLFPIDTLFITFFLGIKEVAFYTTSQAIANMIHVFLAPISLILLPVFTRMIENKKIRELNDFANGLYKLSFIFGGPVVVLILQFSGLIIMALLGDDYAPSIPLMAPLALSTFIMILNMVGFSAITSFGRRIKERNVMFAVTGVVNMVLNFLFMKMFGLIGVAFSTLIVALIQMAAYVFLNYKEGLVIKVQKKDVMKFLLCLTVFCFWTYLLKGLVNFRTEMSILNFNIGVIAEIFVVSSSAFLIYFLLVFKTKLLSFKEVKSFAYQKNSPPKK